MRPRLADDGGDGDDPLLSVVNLVDLCLVLIAALVLALAADPFRAADGERLTLIRDPGGPAMEIVTRNGARIERFRADGAPADGAGRGVKAGVAYRMADGSLVYVPD